MPNFVLSESRSHRKMLRHIGITALVISMLLPISPHTSTADQEKKDKQVQEESVPTPEEQTETQPEKKPVAVDEVPQGEPEKPEEKTETQKPEVAEKKNTIFDIKAHRAENPKNLEIIFRCSEEPAFTDRKMTDAIGILLDIAEGELKSPEELNLPETFNVTLETKEKKDVTPTVLRFELTLPRPYSSYTAKQQGKEVVITIEDFFKAEEEETQEPATVEAGPEEETVKEVDSNFSLGNMAGGGGSPGTGLSPSFGSSGYDSGNLISVDFFKVDLHNVFRILREVSGKNIIVAEGVSGTLTLALNEVPWDFALDIIVNLKDLAKEERLNTIVIYPKDKDFTWPERKVGLQIIDTTEPKPDKPGRAVITPGGDSQDTKILKAKKFVSLGLKDEKKGDLENAVQFYEKALGYWPKTAEKSKLAQKVAMMYLVKLNQNAKAVYFAKKALAADKTNTDAALIAAIGHANMKENRAAQQYFDQSISSGNPSRDALLNYAVFSEQQKRYAAARRLLRKFDDLYGENLESMVSRARILDKQGMTNKADKVYTAILHAGFQVPPDLRKFILTRVKDR